MFGRVRIANGSSGKTVEGMLGGWVAMSIVRLMIRSLPWNLEMVWLDGFVAVCEALNGLNSVHANDNIILPIIGYIMLIKST